tara:strand:+ start:277 stop:927 length:651 start_codon:yes stop_codon:yes gene_type:complete
MEKIDFRTKVFILFGIFMILFAIYTPFYFYYFYQYFDSIGSVLLSLFSISNIISVVFYGLAIFFLLRNRSWSWLIALVPSLWVLFDPTKIEGFLVAKGYFLNFLSSIANGYSSEIILSLFNMILPVGVIIYCLLNFFIGLIGYENKKFDVFIGAIFLIISSISLTGIYEMWANGSLSLEVLFANVPVYLVIIYVGLAIFWQKKNSINSKTEHYQDN